MSHSLERSGALIMREYDQGLERLGRRYAIGDSMCSPQTPSELSALLALVDLALFSHYAKPITGSDSCPPADGH